MNINTRPVALAAGTLFAATAAIDIPHDQPDVFVSQLDWILEALFALALGAGAWALWSLSRQATGRVPRLAWAVAATGSSLLALTAGATHVSGRNVLGPVFGLGILLVFIGYAALAVLDLRRRVEPRFAGFALVGGTLGMVTLGDGFGLLAWSAAWFAVAALLQPADVTARELARTPTA